KLAGKLVLEPLVLFGGIFRLLLQELLKLVLIRCAGSHERSEMIQLLLAGGPSEMALKQLIDRIKMLRRFLEIFFVVALIDLIRRVGHRLEILSDRLIPLARIG